MHILMISRDAAVLDPNSPSGQRLRSYEKSGVRIHPLVIIRGRVHGAIPPGFVPEVVTAQDPYEAGMVGLWYAWRFGARLEIQIHTDIGSRFGQAGALMRIRRMMASFLIPRANCLRVVSHRIRRWVESSFPHNHARISVLPIAYRDESPSPFFPRTYKEGGLFTFLVASRLTREKHIDVAIRGFSNLVQARPECPLRMLIAGEGPERKKLHELAVSLGVGDMVHFLGWQKDLARWYREAHVFLLPSLHEGFAMTLVEAAKSSLPIVSTDVGLVGDFFTRDDMLVVSPGDEIAFREAMRASFEEYSRLEKRAFHAHQKVAERLISRQEYVEAIVSLWKGCGKVDGFSSVCGFSPPRA